MSLKKKAKKAMKMPGFGPAIQPVSPGAAHKIGPEGKGSQYVGTILQSAGEMRHTPYHNAQIKAARARH